MDDVILLSLTALLTWFLWRALAEWGALGMAWGAAWGMWITRELRAM